MTAYKFNLEGLHCANCAAKIEAAIAQDKSTQNTSLNFAAKTIAFSSSNSNENAVKEWTQNMVDAIEDGVTVTFADRENKTEKTAKKDHSVAEIIISLVFFAAAVLCEHIFAAPIALYAIFYGIAVIVCGYKVFRLGFKSVLKLRLDENTLMTIAVIAAFCIGEFAEAALVTLLFAIGEALEDKAVSRSRHDIEKLAEIRPDTANLETHHGTLSVPAQSVKTGDTIVINPFERIPLDGEIISGSSSIDASALTGESIPVNAVQGTKLLSGMMNGEGLLKVRVTNTYENSAASRILKMVEDAASTKGKSEKFITKFAKIYTPIVMIMAILLVLIPTIFTGDFITWLSRALVFLVASCPCAIVISVPLGFYSGIGGASKIGVLIKGGKYIEALAKADTFVFDKTGTLTTGNLKVSSVESTGELNEKQILALAAAAELHSSHPIAAAIKNKAQNHNLELPVLSDYKEKAGMGVSALSGTKEIVCGNYRILNDNEKQQSEKGFIYLTVDGKLQGKISVSDTVRSEAPAVISRIKNIGAKTIAMLTGDNNDAAEKVFSQCSLTQYHAELLPQDKVKIMTELKTKSRAAVFVGDGINDAPVIAASDCGIAMGLGSQAAIEAADAVLTSGNLNQLPNAVLHSRRVINTVKANIIFALAVKAVILILAAVGIAPMWLAVFADTGVSMLCVLNSSRLLKPKNTNG